MEELYYKFSGIAYEVINRCMHLNTSVTNDMPFFISVCNKALFSLVKYKEASGSAAFYKCSPSTRKQSNK